MDRMLLIPSNLVGFAICVDNRFGKINNTVAIFKYWEVVMVLQPFVHMIMQTTKHQMTKTHNHVENNLSTFIPKRIIMYNKNNSLYHCYVYKIINLAGECM